MCEFIINQFTNHLSDWVLVGATIVLAWLTGFLYSETKKNRMQSLIPKLSLLVCFDDHQIAYLELVNSGKNDATNVKLICTTDFVYEDFTRYYNYKNELTRFFKYIAVNQSYRFLLGTYPSIKDVTLHFDISFDDINGNNHSEYPIYLDLSQFTGTWQNLDEKNKKRYLENISNNIRDIKQIFENVSSKHGIFGFNVSLLKDRSKKNDSHE